MFRPLEDGAYVALLLPGNAFRNDRLDRPVVTVNTRRKPERDAKAVARALCCSCIKRACSKGSE
jgi:hypothetical protein